MRSIRLFLYLLICSLSLMILVTCSNSSPESNFTEKVILDVDCGWEMPTPPPTKDDGSLIITDSLDNHTKTHVYLGIHTLEIMENPTFFGEYAILLERYDISYFPGFIRNTFVSSIEDYKYLLETLNMLTFSDDLSIRSEIDSRVVISIFKEERDTLHETNVYYVCADGIVLKKGEKDGITVYYQSHKTVDYYYISALEVKYKMVKSPVLWKFQLIKEPSNYKLCISDENTHKDFTLEEANKLFTSLLILKDVEDMLVSKINSNVFLQNNSMIKITEYFCEYEDDPTKIEQKTLYLTPTGKLITTQNAFAHLYYNGEKEIFYANFMRVSHEDYNFDEIQKLLKQLD